MGVRGSRRARVDVEFEFEAWKEDERFLAKERRWGSQFGKRTTKLPTKAYRRG